jgi:hypothetical protein
MSCRCCRPAEGKRTAAILARQFTRAKAKARSGISSGRVVSPRCYGPGAERITRPPGFNPIRIAWPEEVHVADVHPGDGHADVLKLYWTYGAGALKIDWKVDGDFDRCVLELGK